jgi:hopene-associated glycosyltransferase HpnB
MLLTGVAAFALLAWLAVLALPWAAHRTRERLEDDASTRATPTDPVPASSSGDPDDLSDVCVLVPARDEAPLIARTIAGLRRQGRGLEAIVIDDQSTDGTVEACERAARVTHGAPLALRVVRGAPLAPGWAGKLWALEQGLALVTRPYTLLLDADIDLAPGVITALRKRASDPRMVLVSVMAELHCETFWERLLTPPFVLFFKLLYPFALANDPRSRIAAAAGGCMLVRTEALRSIGGFAAIRGALIDDCSLAAALKRAGGTIWVGMSHSVRSMRVYGLGDFWRMVSRSAFTQLGYSTVLLLLTTVTMIGALLAPPIVLAAAVIALAAAALGAAWPQGAAAVPLAAAGGVAVLAWLAMSAVFWPTVRFYRLAPAWVLTLPAAGALFLAMTWSSALHYWRGTRATWKNRHYDTTADRTD